MTNSEAIETLQSNYPDSCYGLLRDAVDTAIYALSVQSNAPNTLNALDCISRQAAIKAIQDLYPTMPRINFGDNISNWQQKYRQYIECENAIRILPSAEPVRHGHWIKTRMPVTGAIEIKCSECDQKYYTAFQLMWNYCPKCGARMDGD